MYAFRIGANASFGYILDKRLNLVVNAILPKPNVDVHTLYLDCDMGTKQNPEKAVDAEYRTDVTKILTAIKGKVLGSSLRMSIIVKKNVLLWWSILIMYLKISV